MRTFRRHDSFRTFVVGLIVVGAIVPAAHPAWVLSQEERRDAARESAAEVAALVEKLSSSDVQTRRDAAYELDRLGKAATAAVPALVEALDDRDDQVWYLVAHALARIGPAAEPAIPRLADYLDDRSAQVRYRSAHALASIGPAAVGALVESLGNVDERDRRDAERRAVVAEALGKMGPAAGEQAIEALRRAIDDGPDEVRVAAVEALGRTGAKAVAALEELSRDSRAVVREASLRALPVASASEPLSTEAIVARLGDDEARVRAAAVLALRHTSMPRDGRLDRFFAALGDPHERVRFVASHELLDEDVSLVVPRLVELLESENGEAVAAAGATLGRFGRAARQAVPALARTLATSQELGQDSPLPEAIAGFGAEVVGDLIDAVAAPDATPVGIRGVARALVAVGPSASSAVAGALDHEAAAVRAAASRALAGLGGQAGEAVPELMERASDPDARVHAAAVFALGRIRPEGVDVTPPLVRALDDDAVEVRGEAIHALSSLGLEAQKFLPILASALEDRSTEVRLPAVEALLRIGGDAAAVVDSLVPLLDDSDERIRLTTARTIARIGAPAKPATGRLVGWLARDDAAARQAALEALAGIGAAAGESAREAVTRILQDDDVPELRVAAAKTLGSFGEAAAASSEALEAASKASGQPALRAASIDALSRVVGDVDRKVVLMMRGLRDDDSVVRKAAIQALERIGPPAQDAAELLFERLRDRYDRRHAYDALAAIQPRSVDLLLEHTRSRSRFIRGFTVEMLGRLEWRAEKALPRIRELLRDDDDRVRQRAKAAEQRIEASLEKRQRDF